MAHLANYTSINKDEYINELIRLVDKAYHYLQANDWMKVFDYPQLKLSKNGIFDYWQLTYVKVCGQYTRQQIIETNYFDDPEFHKLQKKWEKFIEYEAEECEDDSEELEENFELYEAYLKTHPSTNREQYNRLLWKRKRDQWLEDDPVAWKDRARTVIDVLDEIGCMDNLHSCGDCSEILVCLYYIHKYGYENWTEHEQLPKLGWNCC